MNTHHLPAAPAVLVLMTEECNLSNERASTPEVGFR